MKEQKMDENYKIKFNKERVTEQLEKRHKERQTNLDNLQEIKNKEASESEAVDYFENIFENKIHEIENDLNSLAPFMDVTSMGIIFNKINNSIQELQKYLSNSTIFLTDYKIKKCQNQINELQFKSDEMKNKLIPKKKFGFRQKIIKTNDKKIKEIEINKEHLQKKQEFEWTISNQNNKMFELDENSINNHDITIKNLNNCFIQLHGHPGSLQISNLKNCVIICGPVARSVFGDNCQDCKFVFACQQMRLHSSISCDLYLHVTCRAIVEDCNEISVCPYNYTYTKLNIDFLKSGLDQDKNNWSDVGDFNWLSPDRPSPNWKKMNDNTMIIDWNKFLDNFKVENALT